MLKLMKIIVRIVVAALALLLAAELIAGVTVDGLYPAVIAALVLGLLNVFVRPVLVFLTLPITLLTLGLFIFIINAMLFWFAASFLEGFTVSGFVPALLGSLTVTAVSTVANWFFD